MNNSQGDKAKIGKFRDLDVFLSQEGNQYYLSFGSEFSKRYWLGAFNTILKEKPGYQFSLILSEGNALEVSIEELEPLINDVNELVSLMD
jgi:hypothetical protein